MNARIIAGVAGAIVATAFMAPPALAAEGYFSHGYGAVNKSMAGAGVAAGFDAMSQATNPASLALTETQLTIDLSVSNARYNVEVTGAPSAFSLQEGSFDGDRDVFVMPSMGNSWEIDDSSTWGWAIYESGGMNRAWSEPAAGVYGGGPAGLDLSQTFIQFTYAQEISPEVYLGISPIFAVQRFKAEGLTPFAGLSSDPTKLTDNGDDWSYGYGGKVGIQADIGAGFSFGAAYQTEMFMTDLDKYSGLLANGGEFNIPATLQTGFAWQARSGFIVALDYKRIFYGDVDALANSVMNYTVGGGLLGESGGPGFGWDNVDIVKLGIEVPVGSAVRLRAGASLNTNPISESEMLLNILAPEVQEQHYAAGMTWKVGENHAINLAGMYSPTSSMVGSNLLEAPGQQAVALEMSQWEATIGWSWTF
ncbi:MAG: outer membrane protein transport protein [Alphaproteobacteria bacterium]|nr:outer membrane protein transport protein [Alphaproteobacteria bacterium]